VDVQFITDRGKIRETNEDAVGVFYNSSNQLLAIVADGMGGHQAGEVASEFAVSFIKEKWENTKEIHSENEAEQWLEAKIEQMNTYIYERSLANPDYEGMGTTIVISICTVEYFTIGHVGDSRCYFLDDNQFQLMTDDHSYVNELVRWGEISPDDAEQHPRKNVLLRVIGTEETVNADIKTFTWKKGNKVCLCSDGLTNKVADNEIEEMLRNKETDEKNLTALTNLANERGGEDNISIIVISHSLPEEVGDAPC